MATALIAAIEDELELFEIVRKFIESRRPLVHVPLRDVEAAIGRSGAEAIRFAYRAREKGAFDVWEPEPRHRPHLVDSVYVCLGQADRRRLGLMYDYKPLPRPPKNPKAAFDPDEVEARWLAKLRYLAANEDAPRKSRSARAVNESDHDADGFGDYDLDRDGSLAVMDCGLVMIGMRRIGWAPVMEYRKSNAHTCFVAPKNRKRVEHSTCQVCRKVREARESGELEGAEFCMGCSWYGPDALEYDVVPAGAYDPKLLADSAASGDRCN